MAGGISAADGRNCSGSFPLVGNGRRKVLAAIGVEEERENRKQDSQSDNIYGSPISVSCITEDPKDLRNRLKAIEAAMLGPDSDMTEIFEDTYLGHLLLEPEKWKQAMGIPRGDLKQLLIACARAVAENDLIAVE
ncbi:hypothetical protein ZIOFF_071426 [Zingiber officinale]|uniref:Uncharacterized protein n=1 Tax=Zingiber officinale TaxID=94328 RepID=A0A8J5EQH4_ZINOF|nr:hypothetical protein ZIOFF_071426 [Zingiber officinale]